MAYLRLTQVRVCLSPVPETFSEVQIGPLDTSEGRLDRHRLSWLAHARQDRATVDGSTAVRYCRVGLGE